MTDIMHSYGSSEGMGDDQLDVFESQHKIFLSHSGAQKEFVWHLCEALEKRGYHPFFDKRYRSLPKGERFPNLILKAAQQCQMAVVVVSDDYFMSKWSMIELHAFVKIYKLNLELKKPNTMPKILPLFYGLSISEFNDAIRREKWFNQWEVFSKDDAYGRIEINKWKDAVNILGSFNGITYNQELKEIITYQNDIVSNICNTITPDIKWNDSHVQGKSSICEAIYDKIQQTNLSQKYEVKVIGIYGVVGIGKTTICKTLCNEMSCEYEGRVCHVELESKNSSLEDLLPKVLIDLTNASREDIQSLHEGQCKHMLHQRVSRQRVFLAVDNVRNSHCSIKIAKMYLEAPFHKGSLVVVTAQSRSTLELLGIDIDACLEMPELTKIDAMNLFLHHAAQGKQFADISEEEKHDIELCIKRCYFGKGGTKGYHYHPLALEALGLQLGCLGKKPSEWVKNLSRVRNFSYLSGENPVFDILRFNSFNLLPAVDQSLFMDVIFYYPTLGFQLRDDGEFMEWLCLLYNEDEDEIRSRFDRLKGAGLLQDVDLISGRISVHDLYRELAELEVKGKFDTSTDLENRRWVYVKNGDDLSHLESSTPSGRCWQKLIRVGVHQEEKFPPLDNPVESLEGIEWQYCSNVVLLKLVGLPGVRGALNLEPLRCLRSLQLYDVVGLDRLEGLERLKNLTYFRWSSWRYQDVLTHVGQFPASLKVLRIEVDVSLDSNVLARCKNLCKLVLCNIRAESLNLSHCSSLQSVWLCEVRNLRTLTLGINTARLRSLEVQNCWSLVDIPGVDHFFGLERLVLECNVSLEGIPDLQNLTKLHVLRVVVEQFSNEKIMTSRNSSLRIPLQLRELRYQSWESAEALNLNGCGQLQVLDLSYSSELTCLGEGTLGCLPALRSLNLSHCTISSRFPDLSNWTSLEELNLVRCEVELHEEDISMLARLPRLQPVPIGDWGSLHGIRLYLVRRKVLKYKLQPNHGSSSLGTTPEPWLACNLERIKCVTESNLATPPIRIGRDGILASPAPPNHIKELANMFGRTDFRRRSRFQIGSENSSGSTGPEARSFVPERLFVPDLPTRRFSGKKHVVADTS